jgi:hypothetical protein
VQNNHYSACINWNLIDINFNRGSEGWPLGSLEHCRQQPTRPESKVMSHSHNYLILTGSEQGRNSRRSHHESRFGARYRTECQGRRKGRRRRRFVWLCVYVFENSIKPSNQGVRNEILANIVVRIKLHNQSPVM